MKELEENKNIQNPNVGCCTKVHCASVRQSAFVSELPLHSTAQMHTQRVTANIGKNIENIFYRKKDQVKLDPSSSDPI